MNLPFRVSAASLLVALGLLALAIAPLGGKARGESPISIPLTGPLADYVAKPDAAYKWTKKSEGEIAGTKYVEVILTSQTWKDITWKHQLFLIKPAKCRADAKHALLFITGGGWNDNLEKPGQSKLPRETPLFISMADKLETPIAILLHVPQQPIFDGKTEDQIIAYTFDKYLRTDDSTWPLLCPMVKSAVRGMDATEEICKQEWGLEIDTFTLSGASKRGWTTWLTGAVDKRAVAIAPMVIDTLRMDKQMTLQKESFGDLSEEINDYKELDLHKMVSTQKGKSLLSIVDPYSYRSHFTQPKLIILGTNDPYWPLEALNLYWQDLPGDKFILYCPNNVHGLKDYPRIFGSLRALHHKVIANKTLPKLDWDFTPGDDKLLLKVKSDLKPSKVTVWSASAKTKDFRQAVWTSAESDVAGDSFVGRLPTPEEGYSAMFAEFVFEDETETPYFFSTQLKMIGAKQQ